MVKKQLISKKSLKSAKEAGRARSRSLFGDFSTVNDFKNAALLVSLTFNLGILIGFLALQVTTKFDSQVAAFLFGA